MNSEDQLESFMDQVKEQTNNSNKKKKKIVYDLFKGEHKTRAFSNISIREP